MHRCKRRVCKGKTLSGQPNTIKFSSFAFIFLNFQYLDRSLIILATERHIFLLSFQVYKFIVSHLQYGDFTVIAFRLSIIRRAIPENDELIKMLTSSFISAYTSNKITISNRVAPIRQLSN